jgi:hypothetical protein
MLKQFIDEYDSTAGKGQKLDWSPDILDDSYRGSLIIPVSDQELNSIIAGGIGNISRINVDELKAMQDAQKMIGNYDYNSGTYTCPVIQTNSDSLN